MIELENVTIVSINCSNPIESVMAIKYSQRGIKFKEAILFTDSNIKVDGITIKEIRSIKSVEEYSDFCLRLVDYIDSDFVMVVQADGFILNPELWDPEFLKWDYIGAVWPSESNWIERQSNKNSMVGDWGRVGNGGFSLRSRKFLQKSGSFVSCEGMGEDTFLCTLKYKWMLNSGIKFAPIDLAIKFSYENPLTEMGQSWMDKVTLDSSKHFGFHGRNFVNSQELINLKNGK